MSFSLAGTPFRLCLLCSFLHAAGTEGIGQVVPDSVARAFEYVQPPDTLDLPETQTTGRHDFDEDAGVYRLDAVALRRFATLEEALDALPGFRVRRQGGLGGYSALSFRGARASQVDVYVDGIRLNQDGDAAPDLAKWPLLWFSSLEARTGQGPRGESGGGPGSLARIDLSTRDDSRANFQSRIGSFSTAEAALSVQSPSVAGWTLSVGAQGQTSRNDYPFFSNNNTAYYAGDDGIWRMDNNAYTSRGARAMLRREAAASRQTVSFVWLDSRKEYPGLYPASAQAFGRRSDWLGAWRLEHFDGPFPWETGFQARRFEDSYRDPGQSLGYLSTESVRLSTSGEGDARVRAPGSTLGVSRLDARADVRLRGEETKPLVTPYSAAYSSPDATRGEAQAGLALDIDLTPRAYFFPARSTLSSTFEARTAFTRFHANGMRSFPDTTPGTIANADYRPTALRASLQWSFRGRQPTSSSRQTLEVAARREQRAPTSGELLGDNLGIISKLDLRPEEARTYTLSYSLSGSSAGEKFFSVKPSLQATVFWNTYRDPIRLKAHGASSFMRFENDADYRSVGFESLSSLSSRFAEASLSLTLQEASTLEGFYEGNQPAYQSPLESHAEFFVRPGPVAGARTRLGMLADFRSAYYPGDANIPDSRRDAEWEFGAHADAQLGSGSPITLAFDARNLTDHHYRDFAYSPRSGRSYSLSFSLTL